LMDRNDLTESQESKVLRVRQITSKFSIIE